MLSASFCVILTDPRISGEIVSQSEVAGKQAETVEGSDDSAKNNDLGNGEHDGKADRSEVIKEPAGDQDQDGVYPREEVKTVEDRVLVDGTEAEESETDRDEWVAVETRQASCRKDTSEADPHGASPSLEERANLAENEILVGPEEQEVIVVFDKDKIGIQSQEVKQLSGDDLLPEEVHSDENKISGGMKQAAMMDTVLAEHVNEMSDDHGGVSQLPVKANGEPWTDVQQQQPSIMNTSAAGMAESHVDSFSAPASATDTHLIEPVTDDRHGDETVPHDDENRTVTKAVVTDNSQSVKDVVKLPVAPPGEKTNENKPDSQPVQNSTAGPNRPGLQEGELLSFLF